MTTRTANDLARRVAGLMNMLRPGENLDQRDATTIKEAWTEVNAWLRSDGVTWYGDDDIPADVFRRICWLVAVEVSTEFGALPIVLNAISQPDAQSAKDWLVMELRRNVSKDHLHEPMEGVFM
jgi:hypothetical protein